MPHHWQVGFISPTENSIDNLSVSLDLVWLMALKILFLIQHHQKLNHLMSFYTLKKIKIVKMHVILDRHRGLKANLEAAMKLNRSKLLCVRALRSFGINTSLSDIKNIPDLLGQGNNEAGCSAHYGGITGVNGGYNSNSVNLEFNNNNIRSVCVCK